MPKKWVNTNQPENKRVTSGIRLSSTRLRFLNSLMKEGNISEEFKKYYCRYKKKLTNSIRISTSGNKSKAMWDLIKEELGNNKKRI
jgi:hypothetical protein